MKEEPNMRLTEQAIQQILAEYREFIAKGKYKEQEIDDYLDSVSETLCDYYTQFPEGTEFSYQIQKRLWRPELRISITGEKMDVFECGEKSGDRAVSRWTRSLQLFSTRDLQYKYSQGTNTLTFFAPPKKSGFFRKNPMILASLLGIALGLLCLLLPEGLTSFLVNDLATPVLSIAVTILSGIMGPIMFLALVTAIGTSNSFSEVNKLTTKLFGRFLVIALSGTLLTLIVAMILFSVTRGQTDLNFTARTLVDMLLSVIPTNLFTPFLENNFPQLLVLGIVMGMALLLLNRKDGALQNNLLDLHDWINEVFRIVLKVTPLIPGLTLFRLFAKKDYNSFIQGWKYILGVYICMIVVLLAKLIVTLVRCKKMKLSLFLKKTFPVVKTAFLSGSEIVSLKTFVDTINDVLEISPSLTSIWVPLNQAMLAPIAPIYYVLAPFFIAELTGTPVSISFLFVLLILCVQLSLAYPGSTAGNTIIFNALGLPADYVGLFSAYSVFIKNAAAAFGILFRLMEVTSFAYKTDNIDKESLSGINAESVT